MGEGLKNFGGEERGVEPLFVPEHQSGIVKNFIENNPESTLTDRLNFLLDNFPQKENDKLVYLIEGGAAMLLLDPKSRPEGKDVDVDIVTASEDFKKVFANARIFDAKTAKDWLEMRNMPRTKEAEDLLMSLCQAVSVGGREMFVMSPEMLAVSKKLPYLSRKSREKDLDDLEILNVPENKIKNLIEKFK